jgi:hypothetical protein
MDSVVIAVVVSFGLKVLKITGWNARLRLDQVLVRAGYEAACQCEIAIGRTPLKLLT